MKIKQIYHHYLNWECCTHGMWKAATNEDKEKLLPLVIEFTGNHLAYGAAMCDVVDNWTISCEHHLTDAMINQKAWLGHAACCYRHGWGEEIVRMAWGYLSQQQQDLANEQAQNYINIWQQKHLINTSRISQQLKLYPSE